MRHLAGILLVGFCVILSVSANVCAMEPEELENIRGFFKPLRADIIMQMDEGVLVDRGLESGVGPGDIFSVIGKEEKVYHPKTGKELDTLTQYRGFLLVTKARASVSYCRYIGSMEKIGEGEVTARFENVPVYFVDEVGGGYQMYKDLRSRLPWLLWRNYTENMPSVKKNRPYLVVKFSPKELTVQNQDEQVLFADHNISAQSNSVVSTGLRSSSSSLHKTGKVEGEIQTQRIDLPDKTELQAVRVDDFDNDGMVEFLLGFNNVLSIGGVENGRFEERSKIVFPGYLQLARVSVVDLDSDGTGEIIASFIDEDRAETRIFRFSGNELRQVTSTHLLAGSYQRTDGRKVLIGVDPRTMVEGRPKFYRLGLKGNQLTKSAVDLMGIRQPYGVVKLNDPNIGDMYITFSTEDHLSVKNSQGETLWESFSRFGGSSIGLRVIQPGSRNTHNYEQFFFNSRLMKTGSASILVAQHDGPGMFKNYPEFTRGRLVKLTWRDGALEEVARTPQLEGMISDYDRHDIDADGTDEIVAAVTYRKAKHFQAPSVGLVIFEGM